MFHTIKKQIPFFVLILLCSISMFLFLVSFISFMSWTLYLSLFISISSLISSVILGFKKKDSTISIKLIATLISLVIVLIGIIRLPWKNILKSNSPAYYNSAIIETKNKYEQMQNEIHDKYSKILPTELLGDKNNHSVYDIDRTMETLLFTSRIINESTSFEAMVQNILKQDISLVPKDVLEQRVLLFEHLKKIDDMKQEFEQRKMMYSGFKAMMACVDFSATGKTDGILGIPVARSVVDFRVDRNELKNQLNAQTKNIELDKEIRFKQNELLEMLYDYAVVYQKYLKEWEKLTSERDQVFIAVNDQQWDIAIEKAAKIRKKAPFDKEAHLLLIHSLIERNDFNDFGIIPFNPDALNFESYTEVSPGSKTNEISDFNLENKTLPGQKINDHITAKALINEYLKKHSTNIAPAYLLKGVLEAKEGKINEAIISFKNAEIYYPKSSEEYSMIENLYQNRNYLTKSLEGLYLLRSYRAMMTGAGYYSPNFQLARVELKNGNISKAREIILAHFHRKRAQNDFDLILEDFMFYKDFIKFSENRVIFPEKEINIQVDTKDREIDLTRRTQIKQPIDSITREVVSQEIVGLPIEYILSSYDIEFEKSLFGVGDKVKSLSNTISLSFINNGKITLKNATVIFCFRLTDMYKSDYLTLKIGSTIPAIRAAEKIQLADTKFDYNIYGLNKTKKDIVESTAIVITDDEVMWINEDYNPEGSFNLYYRSGKIKEKYFIKNGKVEGNVYRYYEDGKIMEIIPYKNGKKNGIAKKFDISGKLESQIKYNDDNKI